MFSNLSGVNWCDDFKELSPSLGIIRVRNQMSGILVYSTGSCPRFCVIDLFSHNELGFGDRRESDPAMLKEFLAVTIFNLSV